MFRRSTPAPAADPGPVVHASYRVPMWPHLVTPICGLALLPAAWGAHLVWGASPWTGVGLTLGGTVVVAHAWRAARARGPLVQLVVCGIAAATVVWIIAAVIASPFTRPLPDIWALGIVVGSIVVSVQRGLRNGPAEPGSADSGGLAGAVKALKDARLPRPAVDGARVRQRVQLPPGQPFSDVASAQTRASIASALDVPTSAVRAVPDPGSARLGELHITPVDQLTEPIDWPGPSAPGGSIADPLVLGRMEDGQPLSLWLPGDPAVQRNATHVAIVGMSGAGKTELILSLVAEVLTRTDAELWLVDRRKGEQLPQWLRDAAARTALDRDEADRLLDDLLAEVPARARVMGRAGYGQWAPGCPVPFRVVLMDEAGGLVVDDVFVDLAESCRSVGISLVVGLQRATHDRISTSARANIGCWIAMGVQNEADAAKALSEETIEAGAAPWTWRNDHPGYLHAEIPGVDRGQWAMPGRAFYIGEDTSRLGEAVTQVRDLLGVRPDPPRPAPAPPGDSGGAAVPTADALLQPESPDPSQPIPIPPDLPRIPIGTPPEQAMTPAQARQVLVTHLQERAGAGHTTVRPAELADVLEVVGRSAPWLSGQLKDLCRGPEPLLQQTERGLYRLLAATVAVG